MVRYLVAIALAALVARPVMAVPTVRAMYVDAKAQEEAVRRALDDPSVSESVLKAVRAVVASYEAIVRHYPASSYSDNALWQAARLSLEAFEQFGRQRDKDAGLRLLRLLASEYPTSTLARRVPGVLAAEPKGPPLRQTADDPGGPKGPPPDQTIVGNTSPVTGTGNGLPPSREASASANASADRRSLGGGGQGVPEKATAKTTLITNIRRAGLPDAVRIIIEMDTEVASFHEERLAGPSRIFVDLPSTRVAAAINDRTLRFDDGDLIRQVRIGRHPNSTTRVVLDATGVSNYSVYPLYNPYRLVIDCERAGPLDRKAPGSPTPGATVASSISRPPPTRVPALAEAATRPVTVRATVKPPLVGRVLRSEWNRVLPVSVPGGSAALDDAYLRALPSRDVDSVWPLRLPIAGPSAADALARALTPAAGAPRPAPAPPPPLAATARSAPSAPALPAGGFSMARQLGLGVSRIVIDPGHGGHDPGASGKGATEAELVLDVALRLQKLLEKVRGIDVILTRRTDEFVPLQERTAIANREGADLFLSIHANASANDQARGVETYFLNFANNLSAAAVAARENAASGQSMGALPDFVKAIALNNKLDESREFATLVQQTMVERLSAFDEGVRDLGVKQAPFLVLIGASMPSVLAEISFLTNVDDVKLLKSGTYRQRVAEALFTAIRTYQTSLAPAETVAER
jgi:N-acetylmuramoyl-L-alanine amidase